MFVHSMRKATIFVGFLYESVLLVLSTKAVSFSRTYIMELSMYSTAKKLQRCAVRLKMSRTSNSSKSRRGAHHDTASSKGAKVKAARRVRYSVPVLNSLLSADLGVLEDQPLTSDCSLSRIESLLIRRSFLKKFEAATSACADELSIEAFLNRNDLCGRFTLVPQQLFDDIIDGEVESTIERAIFPSFDSTFGLAQISAGFQVGPGASLGSEEDDFLTKVFHSGLTCTHQDLHTFYVHAIGGSSWSAAEKKRFDHYGLTVVRGSRLSTVPKSVDETRVICTEPVLNIIFQKGIGSFLERVLLDSFGIEIRRGKDLTQPEINRELARLGSLEGMEGHKPFCTIDLKGASDSISVELCRSILPRQFLSWLLLTRSPLTTLPGGKEVKLNMISSMGNAFTFPLQTMIFASIVKSCYAVMGLKSPRCNSLAPTYGVFGDDIICLKEAYSLVCRTLERYGFTVNDSKSFSSGSFRESCGGDFWRGHLVRGVYVRRLDTQADAYSVINRLVRWSVRSGVRLDLTLFYLLGAVRKNLLTVPFQEGDTCGLKVPSFLWTNAAYAVATRSAIFRSLVSKPTSYAAPQSAGPWSIKGGHSRSYNDYGLLTAHLGGFIRDGRVGLREKSHPTFIVRWRTCPNWDYVSKAEALQLRGADWEAGAAEILTDLLRD